MHHGRNKNHCNRVLNNENWSLSERFRGSKRFMKASCVKKKHALSKGVAGEAKGNNSQPIPSVPISPISFITSLFLHHCLLTLCRSLDLLIILFIPSMELVIINYLTSYSVTLSYVSSLSLIHIF